jgi:hypothetical protein
VSIIPVSEAIEKMKRGELLGHQPKCACQLNVDKIGLGYYEKGRDETQEYLEPVWIFSGTLSTGDTWNYYVYARDAADPQFPVESQNSIGNSLITGIPPDQVPDWLPGTNGPVNTTENRGNISQ